MSEKVMEGSGDSIVARTKGYFSESIDELKKVQSPTRQEAMRLTWVVMIIIMFISLCLFVVDLAFNWMMTKILAA